MRGFIRNPIYRTTTTRSRGYLPHWEVPGGRYFITFRLADSLPLHVCETLRAEQRALERAITGGQRPLTAVENADLRAAFAKRLDQALDRGHGSSHLKDPRIADLVTSALQHFDGSRYELFAWAVMPNHVHVLLGDCTAGLAEVVHSWKSFTAHRANEILGTEGHFWAREYFDRIIRDDRDLVNVARYIVRNPEKAGLREWRWVRSKI